MVLKVFEGTSYRGLVDGEYFFCDLYCCDVNDLYDGVILKRSLANKLYGWRVRYIVFTHHVGGVVRRCKVSCDVFFSNLIYFDDHVVCPFSVMRCVSGI